MTACDERPRSASAQSGFSLLELVLAFALLSLGMLMATQVLLESQRILTRISRDLTASNLRTATALLQIDARAAAFVRFPDLDARAGNWSEEALVLEDQASEPTRYSFQGGVLMRTTFDESGDPEASREVARGLAGFRWRALDTRLLEVELSLRHAAAPRGAALVQVQDHAREELRAHTVRVLLRGRGGLSRW